jgi:hypothetical protein
MGKKSAYYKKANLSNESLKMGKRKKPVIDGTKNIGCIIFND